MKALILAAGYGTRLYPLTKDTAKPLLTIGGQPIVNYIIEKLERIGTLNEIYVVTNEKFSADFKAWSKSKRFEKKICVVSDRTKDNQTRLGAIKDIHFILQHEKIKDDLLVIGGDNLFDEELYDFLAFVLKHKKAVNLGLYDIEDKAQATKYGVVKIDAKSRVVDFKEKPPLPFSTLIAMCLYYFPKPKLGLISEYLSGKQDKTDATGNFIHWLHRKEQVFGFVFGGRWFDVGHADSFHEAQRHFTNNFMRNFFCVR